MEMWPSSGRAPELDHVEWAFYSIRIILRLKGSRESLEDNTTEDPSFLSSLMLPLELLWERRELDEKDWDPQDQINKDWEENWYPLKFSFEGIGLFGEIRGSRNLAKAFV